MYYKVIIYETTRNSLKDTPCLLNVYKKEFRKGKQEIIDFFISRYGYVPKGKNKVYVDGRDRNKKLFGPTVQEIGFTHSYWNQDISHNSAKWFQTDWIEIRQINDSSVLLRNL